MSFVGGYGHVDQMPNHLLPDFSEKTRQRACQQPKATEQNYKVASIDTKSSQVQHFLKVLFIPLYICLFSPADKMTSAH